MKSNIQWQRLSPVSVLYDSLKLSWAVLKDYTITVWICIALYMLLQSVFMTALVLILCIGILCALATVLQLCFFKYRFTDTSLVIHSGVFRRKHTVIPFERVQHVTVEEPFLYRWFGLVRATFDTAGHKSKDGQISALKKNDALYWKSVALSQAQETDAEQIASTDELIRRSTLDLFIYGLCHNRIAWFVGVLIVAYIKLLEFAPDLNSLLDNSLKGSSFYDESWFYPFVLVVTASLVLVVGLVGSGILQVVHSSGFKLTSDDDAFCAEQGLFTKKTTHVKKRRLQWVVVRQTVLDRFFGRYGVELHQMNDQILVPGLRRQDVKTVTDSSCPGARLDDLFFQRVSSLLFIQSWLLFSAPLLWLGSMAMDLGRQGFGMFFIAASLVVALVAYLRWYRFGFAEDEDYLYVRTGRLDERTYCINKIKLQSVYYQETPVTRLFDRCHLHIGLAGKTIRLPFLKRQDAQTAIASCLRGISFDKCGWL